MVNVQRVNGRLVQGKPQDPKSLRGRLQTQRKEIVRQQNITVEAKRIDTELINNNFGGSIQEFNKQYNSIKESNPEVAARLRFNPNTIQQELNKRINSIQADILKSKAKEKKFKKRDDDVNRKGESARQRGLEEGLNRLKNGEFLPVANINKFASQLRSEAKSRQRAKERQQKQQPKTLTSSKVTTNFVILTKSGKSFPTNNPNFKPEGEIVSNIRNNITKQTFNPKELTNPKLNKTLLDSVKSGNVKEIKKFKALLEKKAIPENAIGQRQDGTFILSKSKKTVGVFGVAPKQSFKTKIITSVPKLNRWLEFKRLEAIKGNRNAQASLIGLSSLPTNVLESGGVMAISIVNMVLNPVDTVKALASMTKDDVSEMGRAYGEKGQRGQASFLSDFLVNKAGLNVPVSKASLALRKTYAKISPSVTKLPFEDTIKLTNSQLINKLTGKKIDLFHATPDPIKNFFKDNPNILEVKAQTKSLGLERKYNWARDKIPNLETLVKNKISESNLINLIKNKTGFTNKQIESNVAKFAETHFYFAPGKVYTYFGGPKAGKGKFTVFRAKDITISDFPKKIRDRINKMGLLSNTEKVKLRNDINTHIKKNLGKTFVGPKTISGLGPELEVVVGVGTKLKRLENFRTKLFGTIGIKKGTKIALLESANKFIEVADLSFKQTKVIRTKPFLNSFKEVFKKQINSIKTGNKINTKTFKSDIKKFVMDWKKQNQLRKKKNDLVTKAEVKFVNDLRNRGFKINPLNRTIKIRPTRAPPKPKRAPPKTTRAPPKPKRAPPKTTRAPPKPKRAPPKTTRAPPKPKRAPPKTTRAPPRVTKTLGRPIRGPPTPRQILEDGKKPKRGFNSNEFNNKVLLFEAKFRERKNRSQAASKNNPIIKKTLKISTTKNRALKKIANLADTRTVRSIQIQIVGNTNKKMQDISAPKVLNKFNKKLSKNTPVLELVEQAKYLIDKPGEKRELAKARANKKKKVVSKPKPKKKLSNKNQNKKKGAKL